MSRLTIAVRSRAGGALLALAVASGAAALPAQAETTDPPGGFPSWSDIEHARKSESAKAAEVDRIHGLLGGLQARSEELGAAAVTAAAEFAAADAAATAAAARLDALNRQVDRAAGELSARRNELGALAVQSYKTGGTTMEFFLALDALETDSLHGLNVVSVVGDRSAALVSRAGAAEKVLAALAGQQKGARTEHDRLAAEAESRLAEARSARDAMEEQVAAEQKRSITLTAQLASLKGTTAAVEQDYRQGQAALAAYAAAQAARRAAAEEEARRAAEDAAKADPARPAPRPPASAMQPEPETEEPAPPAADPAPAAPAPAPPPAVAPPPPPVVVPSLPGGAVNDPVAAKSYASGRLGSFGWGQDQFFCLARLWTKESNWMTTATNPYSGAYGIPQALPPGKYSSAGSDWLTNYRTQIEWGLGYIRDRYGSPCRAWSHSVAVGWY
ncbi:coiled-coil domain-containing protein [Pseudarthrobacter sp. NPDC058362]|uniref:coiled-coil domain-containing protein n=1 Tax=Pseudarthrobacter sp. NPDC058362 TaxID=3346458 RepID=UPI003664247E